MVTEAGRDGHGKWTVSGQKRKIYCRIRSFLRKKYAFPGRKNDFFRFFIIKFDDSTFKKNFWLALFYRKIDSKITCYFEDSGKPSDVTF